MQLLRMWRFLPYDGHRDAEAEPLCRQLFAIRQRVLGEDHPDTVNALHTLASLLHNQDRDAEAEPLYRQVLAIRQRVLGERHPDTDGARAALASLFRDQGRDAEAESLLCSWFS